MVWMQDSPHQGAMWSLNCQCSICMNVSRLPSSSTLLSCRDLSHLAALPSRLDATAWSWGALSGNIPPPHSVPCVWAKKWASLSNPHWNGGHSSYQWGTLPWCTQVVGLLLSPLEEEEGPQLLLGLWGPLTATPGKGWWSLLPLLLALIPPPQSYSVPALIIIYIS